MSLTCFNCGLPREQGDVFCGHCGAGQSTERETVRVPTDRPGSASREWERPEPERPEPGLGAQSGYGTSPAYEPRHYDPPSAPRRPASASAGVPAWAPTPPAPP